MASDDTRPKVRMLFTIGIVAVSILAGVKFMLDSYYLDMTENYEKTLLPKTEELEKLRAKEKAQIEKGERGNIPVSVAMQQLAQKGRDNASPLITPQPSDDVDPLKGWSKLAREVHLPPQATSATPEQPAPPTGDAGVQTTTAGDAGATAPGAAKDGGAAPAPAGKDGGAPRAPQTVKDGGK